MSFMLEHGNHQIVKPAHVNVICGESLIAGSNSILRLTYDRF